MWGHTLSAAGGAAPRDGAAADGGAAVQVLSVRRDFRLVVTSATLDSDKFARFFGGVPVFEIPGRTFPVEVDYARTPQEDYVSAAVERALRIHVSEPVDGDILIFMTGRYDAAPLHKGTCQTG